MVTFLYLVLGISFYAWPLVRILEMVSGGFSCHRNGCFFNWNYAIFPPRSIWVKKDIHASHYTSFISTVGNINTCASYVVLIFRMSTTLFVRERNTARKSWYVFTVILSLFALVTGNSDNAYLIIGVIVLFLPLYAFRDMYGLKQYMLLISMISTEFMVIGAIDRRYASHVLPIGGLLVSSIIEMIKASKREASVMSVIYTASCYAAQAVVNIEVPIVFPVMFTLLVVGISVIKYKTETEYAYVIVDGNIAGVSRASSVANKPSLSSNMENQK